VFPLLWALPVMAVLPADDGENERAVEGYALDSRYPLMANSCWLAEVVGYQITAIAATLPTAATAAASERAQARNPDAIARELLAELHA
jgi:hypothetical protein